MHTSPLLLSENRANNRGDRRQDLRDTLPGLAVEWNIASGSAWVWNDNHQEWASNNDPELLTRLLRQNLYLPDKADVLAVGKKVMPVDVLTTA